MTREGPPTIVTMRARVTAIVVARNAAAALETTLEALAHQTHPVDHTVVVDAASDDRTREIAEARADTIVRVGASAPFVEAVNRAVGAVDAPGEGDEWLWILEADTVAEPKALEELLAAAERAPSVAVVAPKTMDADDPKRIVEFGRSTTRFGASVPIVEDELDQAQHATLTDIMGASRGGLLVDHRHWRKLRGFDPSYPAVDDALDFSIRTWVSGSRVVAAPDARVSTSGRAYRGLWPYTRKASAARMHRHLRTAQLQRRISYVPAILVPLVWLFLLPLAIVRGIGQLIRKRPVRFWGEIAAAIAVALGFGSIAASRGRVKSVKNRPWSVISPLRIDPREMRRRRVVRKENVSEVSESSRTWLQFFSTGGGWVLVGSILASIVLLFPIIGSTALTGGGLLPLTNRVSQLWAEVGWRVPEWTTDMRGPGDPFGWVLAVAGSVTFWAPSLAIVVIWLAAIPVSAVGAWALAARMTRRPWLRAFAAIGYTLAPSFFAALSDGRLPAVIVHILLPWLVLAVVLASRGWTASACAALLTVAVAASSPSLIPALAVLWICALATSGRGMLRILLIPLPTLVVFAPLVFADAVRGTPLAVFADPTIPLAVDAPAGWRLASGFPTEMYGGWSAIVSTLGYTPSAALILVVPLIALALFSLALRTWRTGAMALLVALLGFGTAVAAAHISVSSVGSETTALWPGSAQSLMWLGLTGAALAAVSAMRRVAVLPTIVAIVGCAIAIAPSAAAGLMGTSAVRGNDGSILPAIVSAQAASEPNVTTLRLTPLPDNAVRAQLAHGIGTTLDEYATYRSTAMRLTARETELAHFAGDLASQGTDRTTRDEFDRFGVDFVLLAPNDAAASQAASRLSSALNMNGGLEYVTKTDAGTLWKVKGASDSDRKSLAPRDEGADVLRAVVLIVQAIVLGLTLLVAIPIGSAGRDLRERARRRRLVDLDYGTQHQHYVAVADELDRDAALEAYPAEPSGMAVTDETVTGDAVVEPDVPLDHERDDDRDARRDDDGFEQRGQGSREPAATRAGQADEADADRDNETDKLRDERDAAHDQTKRDLGGER